MGVLDPVTPEEHERIKASLARTANYGRHFVIPPRNTVLRPDSMVIKNGRKFKSGEQ